MIIPLIPALYTQEPARFRVVTIKAQITGEVGKIVAHAKTHVLEVVPHQLSEESGTRIVSFFLMKPAIRVPDSE